MVRCKLIVRNVVAAALTLSLTVGISSAAFGTGIVTAKSLRLREKASASSATLETVAKGTEVTVLADIQDGWYKVQVGKLTGFMSAEYLDVVPDDNDETEAAPALEDGTDLSDEEAAVEEDEVKEEKLAKVNTSSLNVRSGPGTSYDKVGKLSSGTVVTILDEANGWAKISTGKVNGYVSSEYLTEVDAAALAASSSLGDELVALAKQYLGVRYKYGGASPSGFDCSGFVYYLCKAMGYTVPRTASSQWAAGYTSVSWSDLKPGDLVFFTKTYHSSKYITHVGIYVGGGQFIHSSSPSSGGVIYSSLVSGYYSTRYVGAVRVF